MCTMCEEQFLDRGRSLDLDSERSWALAVTMLAALAIVTITAKIITAIVASTFSLNLNSCLQLWLSPRSTAFSIVALEVAARLVSSGTAALAEQWP